MIHKTLRLLAFIALWMSAMALSAQVPMKDLTKFCDSLINHGLQEKMMPGVALVLLKDDSASVKAYGLGNVERSVPADTTTLFQLGSVGKIFTMIAVLQQVEAGRLRLSADVNSYLKDFKIESRGRPITLFDLLTHTAGFNDRVIGYLARNMNDVKPLSEHLKEYMPTTFQEPGLDINYSNYSYALAGHLVELVSGVSFQEYVQKNILKPLGMTRTTYLLPDNYKQLDAYACGYRTRETFEPIDCYPRHAMPAGSALSCAADMERLLRELLKPTGKVLRDSSMNYLRQRQFTNHPKLMGYTLGMEEQLVNGVRGIAKGGTFTGFLSVLVFYPDQKFGMFIASNTQTDGILELFNHELRQKLFPPSTPVTNESSVQTDVRGFAGIYRNERYNHASVEDLVSLYQGKFEIRASENGELSTYQNGAQQTYQPVDSLLFQNTSNPEQYLAFQRDASGKISRLHTNINIQGIYIAMSFSPVPWYDNPEFINEYYFFILLFILTIIIVPFYRLWILYRRRSVPDYKVVKLVPNRYLYLATMVAVLYICHLFGSFLYMAWNVNEFYFGAPSFFRWVQLLTWIFPIVVAALVVATVFIWKNGSGTVAFRSYYTLFCLCAVIHLVFLFRWHFIGLNV